MDEVKEILAKNKFLSELLGKKGDNNSISEILKKARAYFDKPLRTLPDYNQEKEGPLVEFIVPDELKEIERYWLQEPYTFVSILEDRRTRHYRLVEPSLTKFEKELLERIYEDFQDILILGSTTSKFEKDTFLVDKALFLLESYKAGISASALQKIIYYLRRNLLGYEKINSLLYDPYIEDISCDGAEVPLYIYHTRYLNIESNISFKDEELDSLVIKMCQLNNKHVSVSQPIVDARLQDGSRLQAVLGREITPRGSSFTIRKFRKDPMTPIDLLGYETCDLDMLVYLWLVIENGHNILFAGGTASGKTSMLNATSLFMPSTAKIVSIEDTRELLLYHNNWVSGIARQSFAGDSTGEVSMFDLLRAALRQRPDFIIVGEVRGSEALTLFQAMSTGHATSSTMHAGDVQTVINRLTHEPINVPHVMLQSLDVLCIQKQAYIGEKRVRRTQSLVEVLNVDPETGDLGINELFNWEPSEDYFVKVGDSHTIQEIMYSRGWDTTQLRIEMDNRRKILTYMYEKNIRNYIQVSIVVQAYQSYPKMVMECIENDTLQSMTEDMAAQEGGA
ncbi:type II/IV secretion system ATPase subunit [Methanosarcina sp. Z-7115]|uniref:Type II/IV secretion system ATPase subunit n=1 Tax=Methanosarcina baikalica TaxID=3073890 RepID=A0ABU2CX19_9EURY|nr:type II/IV secretion system ATPase subunit [Methanosarcina sp. Z-7115]MDR7664284.1 type II/IV secretion system ATPase subunit [Methanosarcina sp. Z-7115]